MALVVLIVHLLVCVCLIGLVLLQRSEGGALGVGGGGSGALMSGRGAADALARMTMVAGGFFLVTSFGLTLLSGAASSSTGSVFDAPISRTAPITAPPPAATTTAPAQTTTTTPPDPTESRAPQADNNRLAAIVPGPSQAAAATPVAPTPVNASTRAAPLNTTNRPPATTTANNRPAATNNGATSVPASANTNSAVTRPPAAATTRPPAATTSRAANATTGNNTGTANRPLVLPNTSGAVGGITLTDDPAINPESTDGGVTAVRRERAGPDQ